MGPCQARSSHPQHVLERPQWGLAQGPAHVNAIIKRLIEEHTPTAKQSEHGARWSISGDRLVIVPGSAEIGARAAALQPLAAEALQELADEIGPSNQFSRLRSKADRALETVRKPLPEVNEDSAALWSLSVWLGDFAERDDAVRRDPSSFAEALGEDRRVALNMQSGSTRSPQRSLDSSARSIAMTPNAGRPTTHTGRRATGSSCSMRSRAKCRRLSR
jgi:hypothetical protein